MRSKTLVNLFAQYNKRKSIQTATKFFEAFPNSFSEFQSIYGYDDIKGASPNYEQSLEHIVLLFKISKSIDSTRFATKLVAISSAAKWNADAESYFQGNLREYFFIHPKLIITILSKLSAVSIDHFWMFFLDGPVFNRETFNKTKPCLKKYPVMYKSLLKAAKVASAHSEKN